MIISRVVTDQDGRDPQRGSDHGVGVGLDGQPSSVVQEELLALELGSILEVAYPQVVRGGHADQVDSFSGHSVRAMNPPTWSQIPARDARGVDVDELRAAPTS
ncbi:MAG TPA: hypothetical protein VGM33_16560 [Baekduia sp.]|jgi:hypothetical protein